VQVTCPCGVVFEAQRSTAKYHSPTCRKRAQRAPANPVKPARKAAAKRPAAKKPSTRSSTPPAPKESAFEKATRLELERLKKVDSMLGQQALVIAKRMANGTENGSAVVTLSKEHSRLMAELGSKQGAAVDPVQAARDEVARKREQIAARQAAG